MTSPNREPVPARSTALVPPGAASVAPAAAAPSAVADSPAGREDAAGLLGIIAETAIAFPICYAAAAMVTAEHASAWGFGAAVVWMAQTFALNRAGPPRRVPRYFAALVGSAPGSRKLFTAGGEALPAGFRRGSLGPNEAEILRFAGRLRGLDAEAWARVLHPPRTVRRGALEDARHALAHRWAERALRRTGRDGDASAALATLLRAEFREVHATADMHAPSHAHAAALALLARDAIPSWVFRWLYAPFEPVIPVREIELDLAR